MEVVNREVPFSELVGHRILSIVGLAKDSELVTIITESGNVYAMRHHQDCCETVSIADVPDSYDIEQCIGEIVTAADAETREATPTEAGNDSGTWTLYRITTAKGTIVIRWIGSSNGYYAEDVSFELYMVNSGQSFSSKVKASIDAIESPTAGVRRIDLDH